MGTSREKSYAVAPLLLLLVLLLLPDGEVDEAAAGALEEDEGRDEEEGEAGVYVAILDLVTMLLLLSDNEDEEDKLERAVSISTPRIAFVDFAHPRVVDNALSSSYAASSPIRGVAVGVALFCRVLGPSSLSFVPASRAESSSSSRDEVLPPPVPPCRAPFWPFKDQSEEGTQCPSTYSKCEGTPSGVLERRDVLSLLLRLLY